MTAVKAVGQSVATVLARTGCGVQWIENAAAPMPPPYTGSYEVIPKATAQLLKTKGKRMTEDVSVYAIPYFEVSNPSDGTTVYIGSEI